MVADYALPGSVIALKFLFRLSIGQQVTRVELFKAMLAFPVDLAFLAISFAAIILPYMQARPENPLSTKDVMFWFLTYIVAAFVVTILTRHSDKAFAAKEENVLLACKSRSRKSAQDDKWSFCLMAGTLCPANQERP
jgi:nitric oxide reductase large subunit